MKEYKVVDGFNGAVHSEAMLLPAAETFWGKHQREFRKCRANANSHYCGMIVPSEYDWYHDGTSWTWG